MKQIFLSYSRKDLNFVEKLADDLQQAGFDIWYDLTDLEGGDRWADEIQEAIDKSDVFVTVISPNSVASEWVQKEFLYACNMKKRIIPVLHVETSLPLWLTNLHFIDIRGRNYKLNFQQLLDAINEEPEVESTEARARTASRRRLNGVNPYLLSVGVVVIVIALALIFWPKAPAEAIVETPVATAIQGPSPDSPSPTRADTPLPSVAPETTSVVEVTVTPFPTEIVDSKGAEMILIPADTFTMGAIDGETDELPIHVVWSKDFYIDKYEVTNAQYQDCVHALGCDLPISVEPYLDKNKSDHPVVNVDWEMAQTYCEWRGARLPTEAEWEKAAGGRERTTYPWGDGLSGKMLNFCDTNCDAAWREKNINDKYVNTAPVGTYVDGASPFGVLDMAGNVWEWTQDWYSADYYAQSPIENPTGPESGEFRVLRGGSWYDRIYQTRVTERYSRNPADYGPNIGFRCVRDAAQE